MFIREGLLDPLTSALLSIISSQKSASLEPKAKALEILLVFCQVSQSDNYVRQALGTRKLVRRKSNGIAPPLWCSDSPKRAPPLMRTS